MSAAGDRGGGQTRTHGTSPAALNMQIVLDTNVLVSALSSLNQQLNAVS